MTVPLDQRAPIGPFGPPRPFMRGPYRVINPRKVAMVAGLDGLLSLVPRRRHGAIALPERILVANWAHMGDVVTSLGALAALRERYPAARIGMLVGSWGRAAVEGMGLVDDVHVIDHPMLNRAEMSRAAKWKRYLTGRAEALRGMRAIDYQVGIDLFSVFPPASPLFYAAGIPTRIGYTSGGFGPLLTHPVPWSDEPRPMGDQYRDLLDRIDPARPFVVSALHPRRRRDTLAPLPPEVAALGRYVVVHPGAGSASRHWGDERWRSVIARLRAEVGDCRIVLTGAGAGEAAAADALAAAFPGTVSMAGRASWEAFVRILADAALVICPDTATGHVAALFDTPTVCIFTGTNSPAVWGPYGDRVRILTRPVLCAPCNTRGCEAMACFRGVEPDDVVEAALPILG